ncbi:hypothetical protein [Nitrospirillum viridazoti]|uniref:Secreted protein n=1 Tax=Nitrospirillum viridazoti CBAmc TaxID=1441467 RepID=A0A248JUV0_9PROT|nr:hypothetical protein [Nitrospirillum amazonense]ASG22379.1 hypothetical protein Y958_15620 [Nitrospirillum amazonense CBAmc]TWB43089.1 hypothetical protein FBZ91_102305 [Nitrospirillum amazonense]
MPTLRNVGLLAGAALLVIQATSHAQVASPPVPPPPAQGPAPAPLYDVTQLPAVRGVVRQFTQTPRGDIDGLILADGTEVKTPPHLSSEIAYAIRPGNTVIVHGLRAAALPLVRAISITDEATKITISDDGPGPGRRLDAAGGAPTVSSGRVRMPLHGPEGQVDGALLEDGTVLRLPPDAYRAVTELKPGQTVFAEGPVLTTAFGRVVEVSAMGTTPDRLEPIVPLPPAPPGPPPPRP